MRILGYGEDALTLWALTRRLDKILLALHDRSDAGKCQVLFRPSFGRRGGDNRAEFGEFDFIVLTERATLLGESKWDGSSEQIRDGILDLRTEQKTRHEIMRIYIDRFRMHETWDAFTKAEGFRISGPGFRKALAPAGSLLAKNLEQVLSRIRNHFPSQPEITNVLLFLHRNIAGARLPSKGPKGFKLVCLDYSAGLEDNMISIEI